MPTSGKDNQICIVSSDPNYDVLVTTNANESVDSTFLVYLGNSSSADTTLGTQAQIGNMMYYFNRVMLGSERLASYIWNNSQWNELTKSYIPLFENGEFPSQDVAGITYVTDKSDYARLSTHSSNAGNYVISISGNASFYRGFSFINDINFTNFTKIKINALTSSSTIPLKVCCHSSSDQLGVFQVNAYVYKHYTDVSLSTSSFIDISIDISSWTSTGKLCFGTGKKASGNIYISKISLE